LAGDTAAAAAKAATVSRGLVGPPIFVGIRGDDRIFEGLRATLAQCGDVSHPDNIWFVADNLRDTGKSAGGADAFAAERGCLILELPTGQGLLIKR
jgi:hypothetical protein